MDNTYKLLINILISGNSITLILFGLGQMTAHKKTGRHFLSASVLIVSGFNILTDTAFRNGIFNHFPHLLYISYPFEYLMGPLLYLFLISLVFRDYKVTTCERLLFIPPGAVFLLMLPYYLQSGSVKLKMIPFFKGFDGIIGILYHIIDQSIEIYLLFCIGFFLLKVVPYFSANLGRKNNRLGLILTYASIWLVWFSWYALVIFKHLDNFYSETVLSGTYLALSFFFFYMRNPDLLARKNIPLKNRTSETPPAGKENQGILKTLEILMEKDKVFLKETLTLPDLASQLGIPSYRLSEIINRDLDISFKEYINYYRLKNARELLINEPDSSIIDIAFQSGFRSKSAFNDYFKKKTGINPSRYRAEKNIKR